MGSAAGAAAGAALWADTFLPPTDMHNATTQSTTTDIVVNRRRVISYPFRGLSLKVDTTGGGLEEVLVLPSRKEPSNIDENSRCR